MSLIYKSQIYYGYRSPAVVFKSIVPSVELVILRFVILDVDDLLLLLFLDLHIVSWSKGVDIHN